MKKLNKFFAILVSLAMMATLCVSMAFAVGSTAELTDAEKATHGNKDAKIYKVIQLPSANVTPVNTNVFKFAIQSQAGGTYDTEVEDSAIKSDDKTFTIAYADMDKTASDGFSKVGSQTIVDLFTFPKKGGEYIYTITELPEAQQTFVEDTDENTNEDMTYNVKATTFTVHIYVDKDGNPQNVTIVNGDEKEKSTVEENTINPSATDPEGATFVNKYEKNLKPVEPGTTTPTDNGALYVSKAVDGTYADREKQFDFTITINKPATAEAESVAVKFVRATGSKAAVADGKNAATLTYGTPYNFTLADGEKLVFEELPLGATWTVTEGAVANYQAKINDGQYGQMNKEAATPSAEFLAATGAAFTNKFDDTTVTPTGILISNLPYIALALVAIGGLVAYVVVRRRQDDEA